MEEKKIYFLHNGDNEEIPFKLSKKEKDLIEWFMDIADFDDEIYFKAFIPEGCYEFKG